MSLFCKKCKRFFSLFFFFLRLPSKVKNFNTSLMPPFENFSLDTLNSEQKSSVKKPVDRAGQKPVNRRWFWNLPAGPGLENPDRFHLCFSQFNHVANLVKTRNKSSIFKSAIKTQKSWRHTGQVSCYKAYTYHVDLNWRSSQLEK